VADAVTRIAGRYRLDRQIASGGMGTVWQGWDELLRRPVAVKQLHVQPGLTPQEREVAVQRAMREARITARLHHANAVQVFDVVDEQGSPCLIMQYVPSRSLQDLVRENGPLPATEVARIGAQVAAALAAAHEAGIVHRDVKPANILIAEDGTAMITDFGISHAFDDVTLTSTGMVTGTPAYLAPEVARGSPSDYASDVYSLGSTLYLAVEGRPPFGAEPNPMAVLHRVASGRWEPPSAGGPLTPVLQTMMSSDAGARPSMVDVATTLPDLQRRLPGEPTPNSTTELITRSGLPIGPAPAPAAHPVTTPFPTPDAAPVQPAAPPPPGRPPAAAGPLPSPLAGRRSRPWLPIAAVATVIVIALVAGLLLLDSTGGSDDTAGRTGSGGPSPRVGSVSHPASAAAPAPPQTSATARSSPPSTPASAPPRRPPGGAGRPTDGELVAALTNYFTYIPDDLDAGWTHLTPHFQKTRAKGRESYDTYWRSVRRVDVSNAIGRSPDTVSATLTYHFTNGRVVTQRNTFRFVRQHGVLKIDYES
jgi:serine/threonine protein kinase